MNHQCLDSSCQGMFHCDHCGGIYNLDKIEIYSYPVENPKIIVCEACYKQLRGEK